MPVISAAPVAAPKGPESTPSAGVTQSAENKTDTAPDSFEDKQVTEEAKQGAEAAMRLVVNEMKAQPNPQAALETMSQPFVESTSLEQKVADMAEGSAQKISGIEPNVFARQDTQRLEQSQQKSDEAIIAKQPPTVQSETNNEPIHTEQPVAQPTAEQTPPQTDSRSTLDKVIDKVTSPLVPDSLNVIPNTDSPSLAEPIGMPKRGAGMVDGAIAATDEIKTPANETATLNASQNKSDEVRIETQSQPVGEESAPVNPTAELAEPQTPAEKAVLDGMDPYLRGENLAKPVEVDALGEHPDLNIQPQGVSASDIVEPSASTEPQPTTPVVKTSLKDRLKVGINKLKDKVALGAFDAAGSVDKVGASIKNNVAQAAEDVALHAYDQGPKIDNAAVGAFDAAHQAEQAAIKLRNAAGEKAKKVPGEIGKVAKEAGKKVKEAQWVGDMSAFLKYKFNRIPKAQRDEITKAANDMYTIGTSTENQMLKTTRGAVDTIESRLSAFAKATGLKIRSGRKLDFNVDIPGLRDGFLSRRGKSEAEIQLGERGVEVLRSFGRVKAGLEATTNESRVWMTIDKKNMVIANLVRASTLEDPDQRRMFAATAINDTRVPVEKRRGAIKSLRQQNMSFRTSSQTAEIQARRLNSAHADTLAQANKAIIAETDEMDERFQAVAAQDASADRSVRESAQKLSGSVFEDVPLSSIESDEREHVEVFQDPRIGKIVDAAYRHAASNLPESGTNQDFLRAYDETLSASLDTFVIENPVLASRYMGKWKELRDAVERVEKNDPEYIVMRSVSAIKKNAEQVASELIPEKGTPTWDVARRRLLDEGYDALVMANPKLAEEYEDQFPGLTEALDRKWEEQYVGGDVPEAYTELRRMGVEMTKDTDLISLMDKLREENGWQDNKETHDYLWTAVKYARDHNLGVRPSKREKPVIQRMPDKDSENPDAHKFDVLTPDEDEEAYLRPPRPIILTPKAGAKSTEPDEETLDSTAQADATPAEDSKVDTADADVDKDVKPKTPEEKLKEGRDTVIQNILTNPAQLDQYEKLRKLDEKLARRIRRIYPQLFRESTLNSQSGDILDSLIPHKQAAKGSDMNLPAELKKLPKNQQDTAKYLLNADRVGAIQRIQAMSAEQRQEFNEILKKAIAKESDSTLKNIFGLFLVLESLMESSVGSVASTDQAAA